MGKSRTVGTGMYPKRDQLLQKRLKVLSNYIGNASENHKGNDGVTKQTYIHYTSWRFFPLSKTGYEFLLTLS